MYVHAGRWVYLLIPVKGVLYNYIVQTVMDFKHQYREEKVSVLLLKRSVPVLSGESRLKWTHGLAQYI